eukprot:m.139062 g.139062  ORF g.139062 m.139062 type:complete len:197 (+) comp18732_c0_seq1:51-641(+)
MDEADSLLSMFMSLGTTDHGTLVQQFIQIVGERNVSEDTVAFFLEANNWNLQAGISSYYDQGRIFMPTCNPQAELIDDVTIGEGDEVEPGRPFTKTWRLRNIGNEPWPISACLVRVSGNIEAEEDILPVPDIQPGEEVDAVVRMLAPSEEGSHASSWRLRHSEGVVAYFGDEIWVIIEVSESGTLDIIQQLSATRF